MEQREFNFDEATPLQEFIDKYRDRVVGHVLKAVYVDCFFYVESESADSPVFLVLDDLCIGIDYLFKSHAAIITADESDFEITGEIENDTRYKTITFHGKLEGWRNEGLLWCSELPAMGQRIVDISIGRFSHQYEDHPNSLRPDGGDYFSFLRLTLEDGTELSIEAEDSLMDGYVDIWMYGLPAYASIKAEIDRPASEFSARVFDEFRQVVWGCSPKPDELSELAMQYMRKCIRETERTEDTEQDEDDSHYTSHLYDVIKLFVSREMNLDYVDTTGKALKDLVMEVGGEATEKVLPLIYSNKRLRDYLDWFERTLSHEKETVELRNRNGLEDIDKMYDSLPERVKQTEYGKKLKDIKLNSLRELKMYINAIREYIRPLH